MTLDFFAHLTEAYRVSQSLQDLQGRAYGLVPGIVTDNQDPMGLHRVKVTTGTLGAKGSTDWLYRLIPMPLISLPAPQVGDTVLVAFEDGDTHKGYYLGLIQNLVNPAAAPDALVVRVGSVTLAIQPTKVTLLIQAPEGTSATVWEPGKRSTTIADAKGTLSEVLTSRTVDYEGVYRFRVNGKPVDRREIEDPIPNDLDPLDNPLL